MTAFARLALLPCGTSAYNGRKERVLQHADLIVLARDAIHIHAGDMKKILLVDTEPVSAAGLQRTLAGFEFCVEVVTSAEDAHAALSASSFDLILVEFDLSKTKQHGTPAISGTGLVRELRAAQVKLPILMYTALEAEWYETAALDAGADDFILKRIPKTTLLSRIHAHLRRYDRDTGKVESSTRRLGVGRFVLDRKARVLAADEKPIPLTARETELLELLATNPERVVPTQEILDKLWTSDDKPTMTALNSALKRFRQKLDENQVQDLVENVKGQGFRLAPSTLKHES